MTIQERPVDRGTRLGRDATARIGREIREARVDRGLTVRLVAEAAGISVAELSRIERGLAPQVRVIVLFRVAAVVGLDLSMAAYPGPRPTRAAGHTELLADFRSQLHASLRWAVEVPLPITGDQRAWDGFIGGSGWRYGVEAEMLPHDGQALVRRLNLKRRDGDVDGVLLLLRDTRRVRLFVRADAEELGPTFPIDGRAALERLRLGQDPGGSAVILLPRPQAVPGGGVAPRGTVRRTTGPRGAG